VADIRGNYPFKITAKDSSCNLSVNDNDQRMYEIRVVEDAGSGRDAGGSEDGAVAVPLFPAGPGVNESALLSSYLLSANGDYADYYGFPITAGQSYRIFVNGSRNMSFYVEEVGESTNTEAAVDGEAYAGSLVYLVICETDADNSSKQAKRYIVQIIELCFKQGIPDK